MYHTNINTCVRIPYLTDTQAGGIQIVGLAPLFNTFSYVHHAFDHHTDG